MSKSQAYLDAIKNIDWNAFPDEIKANDIVYIQSEIGGVGNKLPSGENLGVYIPKDLDWNSEALLNGLDNCYCFRDTQKIAET